MGACSWLVPVLWVGRLTGRVSQPELSLDRADVSDDADAADAAEKIPSDAERAVLTSRGQLSQVPRTWCIARFS